MKKEENKFEGNETSELLNFAGKKFAYKEDDKLDEQEQALKELDNRRPFNHIKVKMDNMSRKVERLEAAVDRLLEHAHLENGAIVIHVKKDLKY